MKNKAIESSRLFWDGILKRDVDAMYAIADPDCMFVHIGGNADLDKEMKLFADDVFHPTNIEIHNQDVKVFGDTAVVLTDVDYGLLLDGKETTHHFMVTEVYQNQKDSLKLIQFSFTALVY